MRNALGLILDNDAELIIPRVCGKSGQCKLTTSATAISSATPHQRKPGHAGAWLFAASAAMTCMPIATAISATWRPIRPKPTIPVVLSCNSISGVFQKPPYRGGPVSSVSFSSLRHAGWWCEGDAAACRSRGASVVRQEVNEIARLLEAGACGAPRLP